MRLSPARRAQSLLLSVVCLAIAGAAAPDPSADQGMIRSQPTGPYQWRNAAIVGGGFVSGIIVHPAQKGLIYARTDIGGAYRWDASANRWWPITDSISMDDWSLTGIESLAVDPADPDKVFIAAGTYTNNWSPINGAILRSSDQGRHWQRTDLPFKNGGNEPGRSNGERLAVDPHDGSVIYFGTRHDGLWRSTDAGVTWSKVDSFLVKHSGEEKVFGFSKYGGVVFEKFDPTTGAKGSPTPTIFVGVSSTQLSLYRSTDAGATWQAISGMPKGLVPHYADWDADGSLYVTFSSGTGPNDVTDGAVIKLDRATGKLIVITPVKPGGQDNFGYAGVSTDPHHPGTAIVSTLDRWHDGDTIFRTTDGGKTWTSLKDKAVRDSSNAPWLNWGKDSAPFGHWIGDVKIDPFDSNHVLYEIGWGIWASDDATNADRNQPTHWTFASKGIEECVASGVIAPPSGAPVLSSVGDIDGFRHTDLAVSPRTGFFWPPHGSNTGIDFAEHNPDLLVRIYYGDNSHGSYSSDNGRSWTVFPASPPGSGGGAIALSADGASIVWTPDGGKPSYSHDRAKTWTFCAGAPESLHVVSDRNDPKTFFGFDGQSGAVLVSNDGGASFAAKATGLPPSTGELRSVPAKPGHVWLAAGGGLFHSTDNAATFAPVQGFNSAYRIGFGKPAPGTDYPAIYLSAKRDSAYGIFRSDDAGITWQRINDDDHQFGLINELTGDPRVYGRVFIASQHFGVIYGDPVATNP